MEKECIQCLVGDHCATIIAECSSLFENENLEGNHQVAVSTPLDCALSRSVALHDMYRLLEPVANGVDPIINGLRENILHVGKEKVSLLKEENVSDRHALSNQQQWRVSLSVVDIVRRDSAGVTHQVRAYRT